MAQQDQKPTKAVMEAAAELVANELIDSHAQPLAAVIIDRHVRSGELFSAANDMLAALIDISRDKIPDGYTAQTWAASVAEKARPVMYPGGKS